MAQPHSGVACVLVVGFHHTEGNRVEWTWPQNGPDPSSLGVLSETYDTDILPFLAIPDGAHLTDSDYAFFRLPPRHSDGESEEEPAADGGAVAVASASEPQPLYGVACFRQVASKDLVVVSADVSRSSVQKAVCILSWEPNFSWLLGRAAPITEQYFSQLNFEERDILKDLYAAVAQSGAGIGREGACFESSMCPEGTVLELAKTLGRDLLTLVKVLMLERRVILVTYKGHMQTVDQTNPVLIGVSNNLFLNNSPVKSDCVVDLVTGEVRVIPEDLRQLVSLTSSDKRFMEVLLDRIAEEQAESNSETWCDYDDWIRAEFQRYFEHLLSSTSECQFIMKPEGSIYAELSDDGDASSPTLDKFNLAWVREWSSTRNFALWRSKIVGRTEKLAAIRPEGHPADSTPTTFDVLASKVEPYATKVGETLRSAGNKLSPAAQAAAVAAQEAAHEAREKAGELASKASSWLMQTAKAAPGTGRALMSNITGFFSRTPPQPEAPVAPAAPDAARTPGASTDQ
eukprot:m51a1_g5661 hypothetical protein (515) ;mRNA; r:901366-903669